MCSRKGAASPARSSGGCWPGPESDRPSPAPISRSACGPLRSRPSWSRTCAVCWPSTASRSMPASTIRRSASCGRSRPRSTPPRRWPTRPTHDGRSCRLHRPVPVRPSPTTRTIRRPMPRPAAGPACARRARRTPCAWAARPRRVRRPTRCACTSRRSAGSRCSPAPEEVDLAKRIERASLRRGAPGRPRRRRRARRRSTPVERRRLKRIGRRRRPRPRPTSPRPTCASWCRSPSATSAGACSSST